MTVREAPALTSLTPIGGVNELTVNAGERYSSNPLLMGYKIVNRHELTAVNEVNGVNRIDTYYDHGRGRP